MEVTDRLWILDLCHMQVMKVDFTKVMWCHIRTVDRAIDHYKQTGGTQKGRRAAEEWLGPHLHIPVHLEGHRGGEAHDMHEKPSKGERLRPTHDQGSPQGLGNEVTCPSLAPHFSWQEKQCDQVQADSQWS